MDTNEYLSCACRAMAAAALRSLNAAAEKQMNVAIAKADKSRHAINAGEQKKDHDGAIELLVQAIEQCSNALAFGHTDNILRLTAKGKVDLGKLYILTNNDKEAMPCFTQALDLLDKVNVEYDAYDAVEKLQWEANLCRADSLKWLGKVTQARLELDDLNKEVPKKEYELRVAIGKRLNELQQLRDANAPDGPRKTQTGSRLDLKRWHKARDAARERKKARSDETETDDEVVYVGEQSRQEREAQVPVVDLEGAPGAGTGSSTIGGSVIGGAAARDAGASAAAGADAATDRGAIGGADIGCAAAAAAAVAGAGADAATGGDAMPMWIQRAVAVLPLSKVPTEMVSKQVQRAAEQHGESISFNAWLAGVLNVYEELGIPMERVLALQDALGL